MRRGGRLLAMAWLWLAVGLPGCGPAEPKEAPSFAAAMVVRNMTHHVHRLSVQRLAPGKAVDCAVLLAEPLRLATRTPTFIHDDYTLMSGQQAGVDTFETRDCNLAWILRQPYAAIRPDRLLVVWAGPMAQAEHPVAVPKGAPEGPHLTLTADYAGVSEAVPPFGHRPCADDDASCLWQRSYGEPPAGTRFSWTWEGVQAYAFAWGEEVVSPLPACPRELLAPAWDVGRLPATRGEGGQVIRWTVRELRPLSMPEGCVEILLEAPPEHFAPRWFSWQWCAPEMMMAPLTEAGRSLSVDWEGWSASYRVTLWEGERAVGSYRQVAGFALPEALGITLSATPQLGCDAFKLDCEEVGLPVDIRVDGRPLELGVPLDLGTGLLYLTRAEYRAVVWQGNICSGSQASPGAYFELLSFHAEDAP